jgi:ABC-2 type transport system permease protein
VAGRGILPRTQLGAVIGKELRQWNRDAWRSLEVRSGVWTGIWMGSFALASGIYSEVAPFAGLIVAFMLGIAALSVYSQDGTAIWQTIVAQDATSVRSDVRGRQWAPVIIFLPWALLIAGVFVVLSAQWWSIPFIVALMPAVFGAASGAAIITAAVAVSPGVDPRLRVGPNDAVGNISIHVWVVNLLVPVSILPTGGAVVLAALVPAWWTAAIMIVVGLANGFGAAWLLGNISIRYLQDRMPDVYSRLRYGRIFRAPSDAPKNTIDWLEETTQKGEQQYREQQAKDKAKKLGRETVDAG